MNYTTLAEVLLRLGRNGDLSTTTSPTLAEAAVIHDGVTADVNAALAMSGLVVPVTTPASAVSWLGAVEAWGVCAEILKARFQDAAGVNRDSAWGFFEERYRDGIAMIRAGGAAILAGSPVMPASWRTRNPDEDEDLGDAVAPTVRVDMDL